MVEPVCGCDSPGDDEIAVTFMVRDWNVVRIVGLPKWCEIGLSQNEEDGVLELTVRVPPDPWRQAPKPNSVLTMSGAENYMVRGATAPPIQKGCAVGVRLVDCADCGGSGTLYDPCGVGMEPTKCLSCGGLGTIPGKSVQGEQH